MSDNDIFIANRTFPDAKRMFIRYKTIDEIKNDCCIVLDTNVLLVPYTVGQSSLEEIRKTYFKLIEKNRLIIPGQVAREFANNRPTKLSELHHQLSQSMNNDSKELGKYPLLDSIPEYINALKLHEQIKGLYKEYRTNIKAVLDVVKGWRCDDPVSLMYSDLFNPNIINEPVVDEAEIKAELAHKKKYKLPPGYKDGTKTDDGIGDLLVWKTILELGASQNKSVIFVSGEEKADWWHKSDKQALYPRYELVNEFERVSNGQSFHIVTLSTLLELYGASSMVIDEVRLEEQVLNKNLRFERHKEWYLSQREEIQKRKIQLYREKFKNTQMSNKENSRLHLEEVLEEMVEWFYDNYKQPADGVPHDSREGGYIYCNGGPYDPIQELSCKYPNVIDEIIRLAAEKIYSHGGTEWVKNDEY